MKKHTLLGYEMMSGLSTYEQARQVCLLHHERWDGKGYPTRKSKESIPLLVRIVSVADAIDTMASKRVYKKSCSFGYIKEELERCQGGQFCPQVSKVALDILPKIERLY
jgi:HD-GYP domain-containing protein (c-di-GMP phosphodiesterase class II)